MCIIRCQRVLQSQTLFFFSTYWYVTDNWNKPGQDYSLIPNSNCYTLEPRLEHMLGESCRKHLATGTEWYVLYPHHS